MAKHQQTERKSKYLVYIDKNWHKLVREIASITDSNTQLSQFFYFSVHVQSVCDAVDVPHLETHPSLDTG